LAIVQASQLVDIRFIRGKTFRTALNSTWQGLLNVIERITGYEKEKWLKELIERRGKRCAAVALK